MSGTIRELQDAHALPRLRWLAVVTGALSVVAGVVVLAKPSNSIATLAVITGVFILVDGILEFAGSVSRRTEDRAFVAVMGLVDIVVGVLLIRHPMTGVTAIALLLGVWLIVAGLARAVAAFAHEDHRARRVASAAVFTLAGIVIVASPHIGYTTLALVTGIAFIGYGIGTLLLAWALYVISHGSPPPARPVNAAR